MTWGKAWPGKTPTVGGLLKAMRTVQSECTRLWGFDILRVMEATTWTYADCERMVREGMSRGLVKFSLRASAVQGRNIDERMWFRLTRKAMGGTPRAAMDPETLAKKRAKSRESQRRFIERNPGYRKRYAKSSRNIPGTKADHSTPKP